MVGAAEGDAFVRELAAAPVPCVGVDFESADLPFGYVSSDNVEGIRLALRHLYGLGHRQIATITGATNTIAGGVRLDAFRGEAAALGLDLPEDYVRHGDFSPGSGYRETCALMALPRPPSAILAASDLMALAALQAVWDSGLVPGRDVAVVGFDDLEAAGLSHPPLTTIRQDRDALGARAANQLLEMIEHPDAPPAKELLPVELVVRASSGTHVA